MEAIRKDNSTPVKWTCSGWWRYSRVKRNQRMDGQMRRRRRRRRRRRKGWWVRGGGVMLIEYHSTFKWWETDIQSDVTLEFKGSQASTLSPVINNAIRHLISVNQQCFTGRNKKN